MTLHPVSTRSTATRIGLASVFALALAAAAQAQPASTGGGGQMAYPDSRASGQIQVPASSSRDTGNMAYPSSPGGVASSSAPRSADTGNMAYPAGSSLGSKKGTAGKTAAAAPSSGAPSGTGPTPQGMAAARALATTPSSQPVPYVDFVAPSSGAKTGITHHAKTMAKKPAA